MYLRTGLTIPRFYLGEMKLTPSAFLRQLKYTCSSERFLEISTTNEKLPCKSHINKRNTFFMVTLRYKNIKAPFTVGHKGHKTFFTQP